MRWDQTPGKTNKNKIKDRHESQGRDVVYIDALILEAGIGEIERILSK